MAATATSFATQSYLKRAIQTFVGPRPLVRNKLPRSFLLSLSHLPLTTSSSSSAHGICHLAQAIKGDTDVLLRGLGENGFGEDVKHIIEMAKRASFRREILHTDFLTPPILKESMLIIEKLADIKTVAQGGYPEAERCRLSVGHPEELTTEPDIVAALSISGNFGFQPCSHGDFLGAILGTGIARDKLGDIILQGEKGAHVLVVPEIADFLTLSLDKVANVPVTCKKMPLIALEYQPPRTKSFKTVEASLRIDAIASAGYKISRSKLVGLISSGEVRVNWTTVTKNNTTIKTGDIISVSGQGRLKIGEVNQTRKGKFAVELIRTNYVPIYEWNPKCIKINRLREQACRNHMIFLLNSETRAQYQKNGFVMAVSIVSTVILCSVKF